MNISKRCVALGSVQKDCAPHMKRRGEWLRAASENQTGASC